MIWIIPGKWNNSGNKIFLLERLFWKGVPTIFCKVSFRYLKTLRELMNDTDIMESPKSESEKFSKTSYGTKWNK